MSVKSRIQITVDGIPLRVEAGVPLLATLKVQDVAIPALCYHPQWEQRERCSLCIVEVLTAQGIWKAAHACSLYCEPNLIIRVSSDCIHSLRAWAARLLLARGPFRDPAVARTLHDILAAVSADPDHQEPPLIWSENRAMPAGCILCGRCITICRKIGKNKLTFLGKGQRLTISYINDHTDKAACGKCHACSLVCPTAYIQSNGQATFSAKLYR